MNKEQFLVLLAERIGGLPQREREQSLDYYREMIEDRVDDGMSEEEAVAALGSMEEIVAQITDAVSLPALVKARATPGRTLRAWEIVLLVLGSPVWLSLALAVLAVVLAVYIVLWAVVLTVYALTLALAVSAVACVVAGAVGLAAGSVAEALLLLGGGLVCGGAAVLLVLASIGVTAAMTRCSKGIVLWLKSLFIRKEGAQ